MKKSLCETCRRADFDCPIWEPGYQTEKCIEYIKSKEIRIGCVGNYYGSLWTKTEDKKHYWSIENHDGHHWHEIPESLYLALIKYEKSRKI